MPIEGGDSIAIRDKGLGSRATSQRQLHGPSHHSEETYHHAGSFIYRHEKGTKEVVYV